MKNWIEPIEVDIPEGLRAAVGGHPLVTQVLVRRGLTSPEAAKAFLDPDRYSPSSPFDLPGMTAAVDRLEAAIRQKEPICVWGDFDVDGQTSTTILVSTLRELGAQVTFHIPVRARESHGVNLPMLEQVLAQGARLILTCDTGIGAHQAVEYARSKGVDFVISDHHDLPPTLPEATAVINPKMLPAQHPLGTLPGAGVVYKLAEAMYQRFGRHGEEIRYHDLAALGIVADLAIQTGEARYLVQRGLAALRQTERVGLKALMEVAELNPTWLTETHIGFVLGPRLNALGRLSDANVSVELLTTRDLGRARVIATTLEGLNNHRQLLTTQVFQAAQAQIEREPGLLNEPLLVLANPDWPAGVIGIVASRLVEHYNLPTVLIANPPGELGRGSARSIEGINIATLIAAQADMLANFGGHPMAAGFSIDSDRIADFRRGLARTARQMYGDFEIKASLQIDGYLPLTDLSLTLVEDLGRLSPFGPGNPPLVLASRNLTLRSHTPIGRNQEHLQLIVEDADGVTQKVLWWQGAGWSLPEGRFDLAYTVQASDYRGLRDVQVEWVEARSIAAPAVIEMPAAAIRVVDYRAQLHPLAQLKKLLAEENVQVWCEAEATGKLAEAGIKGNQRLELTPSASLAIWTTPPDRGVLQATLEIVSPEVVYLFGVDPETNGLSAFLRRLAGLVKYALNAGQSEVRLSALAAATAQRESTVRLGLEWLAARGDIALTPLGEGKFSVGAGRSSGSGEVSSLVSQIGALLEESAAFRAYFRKADKDAVLRI